jgi:hypothetical protein
MDKEASLLTTRTRTHIHKIHSNVYISKTTSTKISTKIYEDIQFNNKVQFKTYALIV